MATINGIDVSKYQGKIDWQRVKAAGKQFVFVRLGWLGWNGEMNFDSMAGANIAGAQAAGIDVGVYAYAYCKTPQAAKTAAGSVAGALKNYSPITYPVVFDIEDTSDSGTPYNKMGKAANSAIAAAFLDEVARLGYYGMLYTYKSFAENYLDMAALKKHDLWIAQYAEKCTFQGDYGIWQYAGDSGRCDGVSTSCDLNVSYKDYAAIIKKAGLNGFGNTAVPAPAASESEAAELRARVAGLEEKLQKISEIAAN